MVQTALWEMRREQHSAGSHFLEPWPNFDGVSIAFALVVPNSFGLGASS